QLAWVLHIGGEEHVEGCPVTDLCEEIPGRTVGDVQLHPGVGSAKLRGDLLHGEVQVGGSGDAELLRTRRGNARGAYEGQYQQGTEGRFPRRMVMYKGRYHSQETVARFGRRPRLKSTRGRSTSAHDRSTIRRVICRVKIKVPVTS